MNKYKSPQSIIDSYKKRQRRVPMMIGILSALLILGGATILILSLTDLGSGGGIALFATKTLTPSITPTATDVPPTSTATMTPTLTETPSPTVAPTASGPFEYVVQEGDNCYDIALTYEVDLAVLLAINDFGGGCPINPGDTILIPAPDTQLPTETPIPDDLPSGTQIEYTVKAGDSLSEIAVKFNSLVDDIIEINELEDANDIFAGQVLLIRVNLPTPRP
ncbi:MAG: LysM peptidoglycan-binding domain-containing protein [Anaerolineae bacterium]|nr:LysM peptidoglycan-binding domain-containing protein [Anaerolineae bacterium]